MKKKVLLFFVMIFLSYSWSSTHAYELATHGRLTYEAFKRSVLNPDLQNPQDPKILENALGIRISENPFGNIYYDIAESTVKERTSQLFEQDPQQQRMPLEIQPLSVEGWLTRGAIREDDVAYATPQFSPFPNVRYWVGPNPENDQDSPKAFWRVMNHFYDPIRNSPLTLSVAQSSAFSAATGESTNFFGAPSWALGVTNAAQDSNTPITSRTNHYSIFDAREAMYRALTGKKKDGTAIATTQAERNKYWATTFRALGDVVHLLQDMAQPQHTRNEPHSGIPGFGHESIFEFYIEARAKGAFEFPIDGTTAQPLSGLNYGSYNLPIFTKYSDFWSTTPGTTSLTGKGLADYSNRGFFTFANNLDGTTYSSPPLNATQYTLQPTTYSYGNSSIVSVNFLLRPVSDANGGTSAPVRLTTQSAWNLLGAGPQTTYSLNRFNYDDMASLLIPRAVAYSAGIINYFFRGRIEAQDANFTETGVSLRIRNAIDKVQRPEYINEVLTVDGKLVVSYEYKVPDASAPNGLRTDVGSSNVINLTENIAPGASSQAVYSFNLPQIPDNATNITFRLVYRGKLGNENDAVVASVFDVASGFAFLPSYTPGDGVEGFRSIYRSGGKWRLSKTNAKAGNIDWKGWYVNGKPTKVLSWSGPRRRYFPNAPSEPYDDNYVFNRNIYQHGDVFSVAPCNVQGAAIAKDPDGREWIVVACAGGDGVVVYRRPNKKSISSDIYNAQTAPEGWKQVGTFSPPNIGVESAWFFNGDGTEAQTIGNGYSIPNKVTSERLKLTVSATSVQYSNLGNNAPPKVTVTCQDEHFPGNTSPCASRSAFYRKNEIYSGNYIVAVDYIDKQEVFATLSDTRSRTFDWGLNITFATNGICGAFVEHRHDINTASGSRSLIVGGTSFELGISETISYNHTYDNNNGSHTSSINSSLLTRVGRIHYIDLRYGMVSMRAETSTRSEVGSSTNQPNIPTVIQTGDATDQKIRSDMGNQVMVNTSTNVSSTGNFDLYSPSMELCGGTNYEITEYPSRASDIVTLEKGAWAVDSEKRIFASQQYWNENDELKWFRFVSDGDLAQIVPTPPSDGLYIPVGVIK